ncbi:MAG: 3'(2'), 5'-bisphosphate nucleotidase [Cellvibrionaceae bacterium]|jgi:3'(2'), 5'-bisphosphate nucleotidase
MKMPDGIDASTLAELKNLSCEAGQRILEIYKNDSGFTVEYKRDQSPVTQADLVANQCLLEGLAALTPDLPIISEEGDLPAFNERQRWPTYWLIDPLDGTKGFINRNDEFTVNVALIHKGSPILGVVHVPVSGVTYTGSVSGGAHRWQCGLSEVIRVRRLSHQISKGLPIDVVTSRQIRSQKVLQLCRSIQQQLGPVDCQSYGSSLKLCQVAAGEADLYPRFSPTSEWDTAAAQAIVEAAGGHVTDNLLKPLSYNQKASWLNPDFFVMGDTPERWSSVLVDSAVKPSSG